MDAQLLALGYGILTGLLGICFYLGRQAERVAHVVADAAAIQTDLRRIYDRLDDLAKLAAENLAWHHDPLHNEENRPPAS